MDETARVSIEVELTATDRAPIDKFVRTAAGELRTLAHDMGVDDEPTVTVTETTPRPRDATVVDAVEVLGDLLHAEQAAWQTMVRQGERPDVSCRLGQVLSSWMQMDDTIRLQFVDDIDQANELLLTLIDRRGIGAPVADLLG